MGKKCKHLLRIRVILRKIFPLIFDVFEKPHCYERRMKDEWDRSDGMKLIFCQSKVVACTLVMEERREGEKYS